MPAFWLGTWELQPPAGARPLQHLAIEVLREADHLVVLISEADRLEAPLALECRIGFASHARACNVWRSRGFPVVDAIIHYHDGVLQVSSPYFSDRQSMHYGERLLQLGGVHFTESTQAGTALAADYEQFEESPEPSHPASFLLRKPARWNMARSRVGKLAAAELAVTAAPARWPSLAPIATGTLRMANAWSGLSEAPVRPSHAPAQPTRVPRADMFGPAAFRFREIEVLGFRLDLRGASPADLRELIAPLNPPRAPGDASPRPHFQLLTGVFLVELLRYGRMQPAQAPPPPLNESQYQSQHELVVRAQVGRVGSGGTRPGAPCVHVPAIFVDNPWSKLVGRDLQGFEKCLAGFCVRDAQGTGHAVLRPDGRLEARDARSRALSEVAQVRLLDVLSPDANAGGAPLLDIDLPDDLPGTWTPFRRVDLLGPHGEERPRWRPSDFDDALLGLSFTRDVTSALDRFESVQSTPVDDRGLGHAAIYATCKLEDVAWATPSGTAHLTFHAPPAAPRGWQALCRLVGATSGRGAPYSFGAQEWYRLRFSMDLAGHDG